MNDEISAGLKNALERGQTLKAAVQSFINAGYNPVEVRESAKMLSGESAQINAANELDAPAQRNKTNEVVNPLPRSGIKQELNGERNKSSRGKRALIIGLVILLMVVIVGGLGFLIYYFFS